MNDIPTGAVVCAELAFTSIESAARLQELRQRAMGYGALVSFEGVVRPVTKQGEPLDRLILDHHPHMTVSSLERIAREGAARFDICALSVVHRAGAMAPGEIIVLVAVASDHRRAAFQCADYLMDRLKTEAVFWKREQGPFGERWIEPTQRDTEDRERWNEEKTGH